MCPIRRVLYSSMLRMQSMIEIDGVQKLIEGRTALEIPQLRGGDGEVIAVRPSCQWRGDPVGFAHRPEPALRRQGAGGGA